MDMKESQKFVYYRTYARWLEEQGRRESEWEETVERYFSFMRKRFSGSEIPLRMFDSVQKKVNEMEVMPSMRMVWTAGEALEQNHIVGYNCCYLPIVDLQSFVEVFYILMCGTGVGFSVEKQYISELPAVKARTESEPERFVVPDSREGWADSLKVGLEAWFNGRDVEFDYSQVRPKGARLKTMGGRASGPQPLKELHTFARNLILSASGRQLSSVECLDLSNKIGQVVVVGGVRRSSQISFSDIEDEAMRHAKEWPVPEHRYMSNNSAVYKGKPPREVFNAEWRALELSGTGERGIFNAQSILGKPNNRRVFSDWRTNPCGEILLRARQFCNLSEVVIRPYDTFETINEKVAAATFIGVIQSTFTDFKYIRPDFKKNCEEERLLGVSLTGQLDNPAIMTPENLAAWKKTALATAKTVAGALKINVSVAITTGKPSGTVSQLVDCASGAHARHAPFFIRRYRISATDPLFKMMKSQGVKFVPEVGQGPESVSKKRIQMEMEGWSVEQAKVVIPDWTPESVSTWVVEFPMKSPSFAVFRNDITAISQLEWYLKVQKNWCEHNQSITVYVKEDEWDKVGDWVYENFDAISGVSFLPHDGGHYELAPYEDIDEETYGRMIAELPIVDYSELSKFEMEDNTEGAQTLACVGASCEI